MTKILLVLTVTLMIVSIGLSVYSIMNESNDENEEAYDFNTASSEI